MKYIVCVFIFFIANCSQSNSIPPNTLDYKTATIRKQQLSNVKYKLYIDITGKEYLQGNSEITFEFHSTQEPLRFDFSNGKILSITINGKEESINYSQGHFVVSPNLLEQGTNTVVISYTHPYSRTGNGLHWFQDPEDGEIYLYSQFETNHAKSMFPCFDQPDIKATYTMDVLHPSHWTVISSTIPKKTKKGKYTLSQFPESKLFSTYVFSLHAGPYKEWKDNYKTIPLKLYSRKSMARYVDSSFWFQITKQGFEYYEKYFGIPYMFDKYDQIIVPEFNFGAMENVAAVTYSERYLTRGKITRSLQEKLASVILHEMAHMWFGNLVTMEWWDGLWLNESFATYMSTKAQYEATEFKEAWETFFTGMKSWAYKKDKSITTHPIQGTILNTDEAFTNFDGITYGKGAAVLKQLEFYLGEKEFQYGIQNYLNKFSYSNATLKDFLNELEYSSKKDLKTWSKEWLESQGTNVISIDYSCSGNKLKELIIKQDNPGFNNTIRTHRLLIGLFKLTSQQTKLIASKKIQISQPKNQILWNEDLECPDFIYPNLLDYGYIQFKFPSNMFTNLNSEKLSESLLSHDNLTKLMLIRELFEQVKEGEISIKVYKDLLINLFTKEISPIVIESYLWHISGTEFPSYVSLMHLNIEDSKNKELNYLEIWFWEQFLKSNSYEFKKLWFTNWLKVGYTINFQNKLLNFLKEKETVPGFPIDQDIRWSMLKKYCSLKTNYEDVSDLISNELKRDKSKIGKDSSLACEAAIQDPLIKAKWMQIFLNPGEEYSASTLRSVMYNIFPIYQKSLQEPFVDFFLQNIKEGKINGDENYLESYVSILSPSFCNEKNYLKLKRFIEKNKHLPPYILNELILSLESEKDCIQIRKKLDI